MQRKVLMASAALLGTGGVAFAAVLIATLPAQVTVNEAFSTTTASISISLFPGETGCSAIAIDNAASVPLDAEFVFSETSNPNLVVYTTDMPKTVTLSSGANSVDACFSVDSASPAGPLNGTVAISRV
jgi:hypothetical protein